MDYNAVTAFAYSSASVLSCLMFLFLTWSAWLDRWKWPLAAATAVQTLWLTLLSLSLSGFAVATQTLLLLEGAFMLTWTLAFSITLGQLRPHDWPLPLKLSVAASIIVALISVVDIVYRQDAGSLTIFAAFLLLSLLALLSLEQLARNAGDSRFIRLLAVSLGLLFLFNIYLYAQGMINRSVDLVLWQARAALIMAANFVVVSAGLLFHDRIDDDQGLGVSRPVAFYSASLLITSTAIVILALGGYYVRNLEGHWGIFLFSLMLFFSLVALSALFLSDRVRSRIQVWLSKHFFRHKYDYRLSWLSVIQALAEVPNRDTVYRTVYTVFARIFQATGGTVFVKQQNQWQAVFQSGEENDARHLESEWTDETRFIQIMQEKEWVFVTKAENGPISQWNATLPEWIREDPHVQLIVPLIAQQQLIGFVTLEKPGLDADLGWEDLDILKTIGRQLANHILLHARESQLSEAKQLDTYHKLSAFIMHDLNNLIAQLALVVRNSDRHKHNPAFIDDMIETVNHSAVRMTALMQKFRRIDQDLPSRFTLVDALRETVKQCRDSLPKPRLVLTSKRWNPEIVADRDHFLLAIKHLVKNAQQATPVDGSVTLRLTPGEPGSCRVMIEDTGCGMSREFIESRLFSPFETTKTGQGMGIGAYLTRTYLNDLGGSLNVESRPGHGTTMIMEIPMTVTEEVNAA